MGNEHQQCGMAARKGFKEDGVKICEGVPVGTTGFTGILENEDMWKIVSPVDRLTEQLGCVQYQWLVSSDKVAFSVQCGNSY